MPATEADLFSLFDRLAIRHSTVEHAPLFTVEDGADLHHTIPGLHCKNLFLKDKKGKIWLVVMPGDKRANLNSLEKKIGAARLSFARAELLLDILGLTPGSVTPFGLMNDTQKQVTVVLDEDMLRSDKVNFHPLRNTASTTIGSEDLVRFIKELAYSPVIANCGEWVENIP